VIRLTEAAILDVDALRRESASIDLALCRRRFARIKVLQLVLAHAGEGSRYRRLMQAVCSVPRKIAKKGLRKTALKYLNSTS
jgi:hypothetical protein